MPKSTPPMAKSVLIVRLGAIGDVVNALVVANAIKCASPETEIGWAVHPLSAPLIEGHPSVDRVHTWARKGGFAEFARLRRELRAHHYGAALDLQRLQKSSLLARASGASRVIGFDRARTKECSWLWTKESIAPGPKREHMVLQYMRFTQELGIHSAIPQRDLPHVESSAAWASEFTAHHGRPLLLNLGASKQTKKWPVESFRAVALRALDGAIPARKGPVVLTGGPGDREAAADIVKGLDVIDLTGETSLPDLWELCRLACTMVTADTGPMHMCAAVGTPVVAIFGPGDPARTGPFGERHVVLQGDRQLPRTDSVSHMEPCAPVGMETTSVPEVIRAVNELLATA